MENRIFVYSPRFNISSVSSNAPEYIKTRYKSILSEYVSEFKEDSNIDKEDWIESIIPLIELFELNLFKESIILLKDNNVVKYIYLNENIEINIETKFIVLGVINNLIKNEFQYKDQIIFPLINNEDILKIEGYYKLKTFKTFAKRWFTPASYYIKDFDNYLKDIELLKYIKSNSLFKKIELKSNSFKDNEVKNIFIKTVKKGFSFSLTVEKNEKNIYSKFINEVGYESERISASKDNFLIQEHINMRYEYRLIIINNTLICGAGCVEEFTPLDNNGEDFDIKLKEYRYDNNITENNDLVQKYISKVKLILKHMNRNNEKLKHCTIDLALNDKDEVILIEFNPYVNIGYYALKYRKIIEFF